MLIIITAIEERFRYLRYLSVNKNPSLDMFKEGDVDSIGKNQEEIVNADY